MRILVTGGTSKQTKPPEQRGNSGSTTIDVPAYIVEAMELAGHEVEWRNVRPGEDLSGFDLIWMGWAPWLSRTTPETFGAMWAWKSGLPMVVFLDDWAFHQGFSHLRTICKRPEHYLCRSEFFGGRAKWTDEQLTEMFPLIDGVYDEMVDPSLWRSNIVLATPQYGWGSTEVVRQAKDWAGWGDRPIFKLDPSGHVVAKEELELAIQRVPMRQERWALASLSPQKEWVDKQLLQVPVAYFGCRSLHRKGTESPRLKTEADVVFEYAQSAGVLAPPYNRLKGAAWFRSRWLYGALGGAAVLSDPEDALPGVPHQTGREIEAMTSIERAFYAMQQSEFVLSNIWSTEKFNEQVARIVGWTAHLT